MIKVNCKAYADRILDLVKMVPNKKQLLIFTAGDDPASASYMKGKMRDAERCGVPCSTVRVETMDELVTKLIIASNHDRVGGIIVQLPLPDGFDADKAMDFILTYKDVDGFKHNSPFLPCTPEGIMYILHEECGNLEGKTALVIGRGKLVGKPIADMLLKENCTVTIAHSKTTNLDDLIQRHDIIISGVGRAKLIDLKKCKAQIVIDAGVNKDGNGKLCGDCFNFDPNDGSEMKVTPVPGGVGLMTRAILMKHAGRC